jgi:hypothetical protein
MCISFWLLGSCCGSAVDTNNPVLSNHTTAKLLWHPLPPRMTADQLGATLPNVIWLLYNYCPLTLYQPHRNNPLLLLFTARNSIRYKKWRNERGPQQSLSTSFNRYTRYLWVLFIFVRRRRLYKNSSSYHKSKRWVKCGNRRTCLWESLPRLS